MTEVPTLFARLAELAEAEGAVPDDGSGIDGVWTTTVPAEAEDRPWRVAMNADLSGERAVSDFPTDGAETEVGPGEACVCLGAMPVVIVSQSGGSAAVFDPTTDRPLEDELIEDVERRIASLEETDGGDP